MAKADLEGKGCLALGLGALALGRRMHGVRNRQALSPCKCRLPSFVAHGFSGKIQALCGSSLLRRSPGTSTKKAPSETDNLRQRMLYHRFTNFTR